MKFLFTVKARIALALGLLGVLSCLIATFGLVGLKQAEKAHDETYRMQLGSSIAISKASILLVRSALFVQRVVALPDDPNSAKTLKDAEQLIESSNSWWAKYSAIPKVDAEEISLAEKTKSQREILIEKTLRPIIKDLEGDRRGSFDKTRLLDVATKLANFNEANTALNNRQAALGQVSFEKSSGAFSFFVKGTSLSILLTVVLSWLVWWWLNRSISSPLGEAKAAFANIASGDLSKSLNVTHKDEFGEMLTSLDKMRQDLVQTMRVVSGGADAIASASVEIANGNLDLSNRTEAQAASLEQTASVMEQLTTTVQQNSENVRQANKLVQDASAVAVKSGEVVTSVMTTMDAINESSNKIGEITGVIHGIAFQTNILALNAAVEAARAGEHGRGFSVVASEVRALAQRCSVAAKEIKNLIDESASRVQLGSDQVQLAGTEMKRVVSSVNEVTSIVSHIANASAEQAKGISHINTTIAEMDRATQQNAALVEESAAAARAMQERSEELAQVAGRFRFA